MVLGRAAVCSVVHTDSSGVVWPQGACVCVCVCSCLLLARARRGSHRLNLTRPLTDRAVPSTSACRPVCGAPSDPSALLRRGDAACVPFPQPCGHRPALCRHAARVPVRAMLARCNVCTLDAQCDHSACSCYARKLGSPLPLWCWAGSLCGRAWRWDPSSRYLHVRSVSLTCGWLTFPVTASVRFGKGLLANPGTVRALPSCHP